MKFTSVLCACLVLCVLQSEDVCGIKFPPFKRFFKMVKKQLKKRVPTRNNAFDDSVVYAKPTHDGQGFVLYGYGKPYSPYAYDNDVDIYQIPKMWNGVVKIPNMFKNDNPHSYDKDRIVKGLDNRLGFRLAIPYIGDMQYIREIGPGRFTDNLGPGAFHYPGFKDKMKQNEYKEYHSHNQYGHPPPPTYDKHHSSGGYGQSEHHHAGYDSGHYGSEVGYSDYSHIVGSSSEIREFAVAPDELGLKSATEETHAPDPYEGMRNYPWNA